MPSAGMVSAGSTPRSARSLTLLLVSCLPLSSLLSCGSDNSQRPAPGNTPPSIHAITIAPPRVHLRQRIAVTVKATDADEDPLGYVWSATRGTFPAGNVLSTVVWLTARTMGSDTVKVQVTDGTHVVNGRLAVSMVDLAPPDSIDFVVDASAAELTWSKSIDEGIEAWSGYEVYQARQSLDTAPPDTVYPAAPDDGRRVVNLRRGVKYFFRVRSVRQWGDAAQRGPFSREINLSPRPEGIVQLRELGGSIGTGTVALDFSSGLAYGILRSLDPADTTGVADRDLYVGTSDSLDRSGPLYLKSISRLSNRDPAWGRREVRIKRIGTDWTVNTTGDSGWQDEAPLVEGDVYAVLLPEGNYAKIQVVAPGGVTGSYPYRMVRVRWAYQTIPDYADF